MVVAIRADELWQDFSISRWKYRVDLVLCCVWKHVPLSILAGMDKAKFPGSHCYKRVLSSYFKDNYLIDSQPTFLIFTSSFNSMKWLYQWSTLTYCNTHPTGKSLLGVFRSNGSGIIFCKDVHFRLFWP